MKYLVCYEGWTDVGVSIGITGAGVRAHAVHQEVELQDEVVDGHQEGRSESLH